MTLSFPDKSKFKKKIKKMYLNSQNVADPLHEFDCAEVIPN